MIAKYRLSQNWNVLPPADHMAMVAVWLEVLDVEGVPTERIDDCYRAEMSRRAELKAEGREVHALTADDLASQWRAIKKMHAEIDNSHTLPQYAAGACPKCYGTGMERMSDGSVRPGCLHIPSTDDSRPQRDPELVKQSAEILREAVSKIGKPKPPVVREPAPKPIGQILTCSKCNRQVNTYFGSWEPGSMCGDLLNRYEGEPQLCDGTMV